MKSHELFEMHLMIFVFIYCDLQVPFSESEIVMKLVLCKDSELDKHKI